MATKSNPMININTASMQELTSLNGIGHKLAQLILDHRPFSGIKDLVKVPGISETKFGKLLPNITISDSRTPSSHKAKPKKDFSESNPEDRFGETEAFIFLENRNVKQDALLIIFGVFILGLIILLIRRKAQ